MVFGGLATAATLRILATVGLCLCQAQSFAALQEPHLQDVAHSRSVGAAQSEHSTAPSDPFLIALRREVFPVWHKGKVISYKTSYSGAVSVGSPVPQEFRVVFDTGSGHLVLPSVACESVSCLAHKRYDIHASETAAAITLDGRPQPPNEASDLVTIGFGTGKVKGEFVRERVCVGQVNGTGGVCVGLRTVMAIEMSRKPFESFAFDGILGLGLSSLALSKEFSFFDVLTGSHQLGSSQFAVFLAPGKSGDDSEIAIGGYNRDRVVGPFAWVPAARPQLGYWQVEIKAIHLDGKTLDICADGSCTGVMDTGTTHLGIPTPFDEQLAELLDRTVDGGLADCRTIQGSTLDIELQEFNITLAPWDYMRQLPLSNDITVGKQGVSLSSYQEEADGLPNETTEGDGDAGAESQLSYHCRPKLMPVSLPAPLGPKLFILGEPVLHRYYTVFDWERQQLGFGLANHGDTAGSSPRSGKDLESSEDTMILMQVTVLVTARGALSL